MNKVKAAARRIFVRPVVSVLLTLRVPPTAITLSSLVFAAATCLLFSRGRFLAGAGALLVCGLTDALDGDVARLTYRTSRFGGFLDSTIDRVNEFLAYLGLFLIYLPRSSAATTWTFLAMFGSILVSYTRARAEGLGTSPQVGLFERFTRLAILIICAAVAPRYLPYALAAIAVGSFFTAGQRVVHAWLTLRSHPPGAPHP